MGRRRPGTLLRFLILLPLLTGCFTVEQDIWINPDGSGRLHLDIGIPESGGEPGPGGLVESEIVEDLRRAARPLVGDPRLRSNPVVSWYSRDGFDHAELDLNPVDWHLLPAIAADVLETAAERIPGSAPWTRLLAFSIEEDEEGLIWFSEPPAPQTSFLLPADHTRLVSRFGEAAMAEFLDTATLTVTLHSPTISSTNGQWMLDKASVSWSTDLQGIGRGHRAAEGFSARIGASARSTHFLHTLLIVAAVSLLVALLTWFGRRRLRRRIEQGEPPR